MQNRHQAVEHLTAQLLVDMRVLIVVHFVRFAAGHSRAKDLLNKQLDFLLVVHAVAVVDVASFGLLVQALALLRPLLQPLGRVACGRTEALGDG